MPGGGTWTNPKTWTAAVVSVAEGNTHWRDNLNALTDATSIITTIGTQTALAIPTGRGRLLIVANNASLLTIQGITAAGFDGQELTIYSIGAGQVDLANQNGSASEANRIINGVTGTISLAAGIGRVVLQYDMTTTRWRVIDHDQGTGISVSHAGGNFTGAGSMTWTVASGDQQVFTYYLRGRQLTIRLQVVNSTVGGTPDTRLQAAIPGGFTAAYEQWGAYGGYKDNAVSDGGGTWQVAGSGTVVRFFIRDRSNWTASTDATDILASVTFEVT